MSGSFLVAELVALAPSGWVPPGWTDIIPGWVEDTIVDRQLPLVAGILVGSYLLARIVQWWGRREMIEEEENAPSSFRLGLLEETYRPLAVSIAIVGVYASLRVLGAVEASSTVANTVATVLILVWMRTAVRVGARWIEHVKASEVDYEFAPMFKNLWTVTVVGGGALLMLSIWEIRITPFLASAGILGIVIGFAAQDGISNLIGGVALYFDNTYKIGDVILVDDDRRGTVTDIGIRSTTVLTTDNRVISVPNSVLNSTQVVNETVPQRYVRIDVPFTVAYGTDYREVERILHDVCEEASLVRAQPAPRVLFEAFGDSALVFELRAFISHPLTEKRAIDQLNRLVADAFAEAGIVVPFPQRTLSYLDDEPRDDSEHRFDDRFATDETLAEDVHGSDRRSTDDDGNRDASDSTDDRPHDGHLSLDDPSGE